MQAQQPSQLETRDLQEPSRVPTTLDLSTLEACCRSEIENNCLVDPTTARFSIELLRRATSQDNQQAWEAWQRCFSGVLRSWLRRHPRAELLCYLDSEEHYLTRTFECFRQAVTEGQLSASTALSTAFRYLQACLNGVFLDALRSKAHPKGIAVQEPSSVEQARGDHANAHHAWLHIQALFPDPRDEQVAYLLFHCHLSQEEIFYFAPQGFSDVQEIHHLRHEMFQRIVHHADCMY